MPKPKVDKLKKFKEGEYHTVFVQAKISPIIYKNMLDSMQRIGLNCESTYIVMALQNFNHVK